ncbi:30S ribosomal protein S1 [Candidatus Sumerlaeota bacterium]|nr:30S ribosomal protein S1 [Candidatus Sumerlaeota bacterium]
MAPNNPNTDKNQQAEELEFSDEPVLGEEEAALEKEFAALLDQHLPGAGGGSDQSRQTLMDLTVVAIRDNDVLVDIGGKEEASIPLTDFPLIGEKRDVKVGQQISAVQMGRNEDGSPRLSHRLARTQQAQKHIQQALENKVPIRGTVSSVVKGGVMVDIGLEAFMPASQIDLFKIPDLNKLQGQEIEAYVLEYDPGRKRAVLSRRQLLFERRESTRKEFLDKIIPGSTVKGKVKSALDFGVFVELGTVDGFIPREEISWDRGKSPAEVMAPGTEIELKVLNVSSDTGKVTLSRKRLTENPWDKIEERFPVGSNVRGKVVAVQQYGAFVHLEEGVTGMIHASDMSWSAGNKKPTDYVREGDEVTCQVIEVNKEKKRLSLGLKQLSRDPWSDVEEKYTVGSRHKGTVTSITNYGAFVKLDDFIEGMVHVSDLTWEKRVNHPKEYLKNGDEVEVVVLKLDRNERRISLGIKQLADSPFDAYLKAHPQGSIVTGKVTRFAPFGAFVELAPGLEGLIHISQIDEKRVELPEKALKLGEEVTAKIIATEKKNQKISLSRKEAIKAAEKENIRSYMKKENKQAGMGSMAEAFQALKEKKNG